MVLIVAAFLIVIDGFALTQMWNWFVPLATNFPSINVPLAIGLTSTVTLVRLKIGKHPEDFDLIGGAGRWLSTVIVVLVIGFIAHTLIATG